MWYEWGKQETKANFWLGYSGRGLGCLGTEWWEEYFDLRQKSDNRIDKFAA
jgi:hypothetical protein